VPFFLKPHISFVKPLIRRREARRLRMIRAQAQGRNPTVPFQNERFDIVFDPAAFPPKFSEP
jgi:hypothetical protein